jgi:hypothetical protein
MNKGLHIDRVDKIKAYRELRNKLKTIGTYKSKKPFKHLKSPGDFLNAVRKCEVDCEKRKCAAEKASLLWFLEKLIREARIFDNGSFLLLEPTIERFKPVLHVGWGMDCLSDTGFDFPRFTTVLETSADPKYRLLTMEPIGVVYTAARQPLRSFIIGINVPSFPDPEPLGLFFDNISEPETQMISHGYGRGIYFKVFSLRSALEKALNCPCFFDPNYAIKGVAFACTMVNNSHLDRVFLTARTLVCNNVGREECRYFSEGISSALSFLEWNSPGFLESLEENTIIERAKELMKTYQADGGVYKF